MLLHLRETFNVNKMRALKLIIVCVLLGLELNGQDLTLKDFVFDEKDLPQRCIAREVKSNSILPCGINQNHYISSDQSYLDCFAASAITDSNLIPKVKSALFSVYQCQNEIGIFAFEMDSKKTAEFTVQRMQKLKPDNEYLRSIQVGRIALFLWQDGGDNDSFDEFQTLIATRAK